MIEFIKNFYDEKTLNHVLGISESYKKDSDCYYLSLLHDIIEDTEIEISILEKELHKINKVYLLDEVLCITRNEEETYFEYIDRLNKCENGICRKVKIKDLNYNLSKKDTLKPSLKKRYLKAIKILSEKGDNNSGE